MAFKPPTNYNSTIMVNQNYEIVSPTVEELTAANPILTYNSNLAKSAAATATSAATSATSSAQTAQQAAAQATEIVDPEGWRTATRAMIARLALTKSDSGTLYFSGGSASTTPNFAFNTLSVLFKTDFDFSVPQTKNVLYPFYIGTTTQGKYILVQFGADNRLRINTGDGEFGNFSRSDIAALVGDGVNALAFVFKKLADGNAQVSLFVNGVSVQNLSTATVEYPALESFLSINKWGSSSTSAGTVGYSDFRILNFDVSATDAPYTLADYQAGKRLPPWGTPLIFGNGVSASVNYTDALCAWDGANWSMTQKINDATFKSMLFNIPMSVGQRLRIKFSNLTGGVLVDGKYGFFQPVGQEVDQINVSTTSLDAEFTAKKPISIWRFKFNCEAVSDTASRVPTVFENFVVERDGAIVALENYTIARNTTTKLIKDASGNGNDATVSGNVAGDRDNGIAAFVDELKTQINQQA